MDTIVGRKIRVDVGKTEGAPIAVTEVTNAKPAVASAAAHGLLNKSLGYFENVVGMAEIEGQACRVANTASGTFELEGLKTTSYGDYTSGSFVPVTDWATCSEITNYNIPDATAESLDDTWLIHNQAQTIGGNLAAQDPVFTINAQQVPSEGMAIVEEAAEDGELLVFRITYLGSGRVRFFRGQPGKPGENVPKGQVGTGSFTVNTKGRILRGAA